MLIDFTILPLLDPLTKLLLQLGHYRLDGANQHSRIKTENPVTVSKSILANIQITSSFITVYAVRQHKMPWGSMHVPEPQGK